MRVKNGCFIGNSPPAASAAPLVAKTLHFGVGLPSQAKKENKKPSPCQTWHDLPRLHANFADLRAFVCSCLKCQLTWSRNPFPSLTCYRSNRFPIMQGQAKPRKQPSGAEPRDKAKLSPYPFPFPLFFPCFDPFPSPVWPCLALPLTRFPWPFLPPSLPHHFPQENGKKRQTSFDRASLGLSQVIEKQRLAHLKNK